MPIPAKLNEQIETLSLFSDRQDRIQALIDIGESFHNAGESEVPRTAENRVPGCESEVFLSTTPSAKSVRFRYAVDNPQGISAMALASILEEGLSDAPFEEIAQVPDETIYDIFGKELSMGKSLGLINMLRMAKAQAARLRS